MNSKEDQLVSLLDAEIQAGLTTHTLETTMDPPFTIQNPKFEVDLPKFIWFVCSGFHISMIHSPIPAVPVKRTTVNCQTPVITYCHFFIIEVTEVENTPKEGFLYY